MYVLLGIHCWLGKEYLAWLILFILQPYYFETFCTTEFAPEFSQSSSFRQIGRRTSWRHQWSSFAQFHLSFFISHKVAYIGIINMNVLKW